MSKKIVTSLMVGFLLGLTFVVIGFFSIISYGLTHTPWHYHPFLLSVPIMDFTTKANGSFAMSFGSGLLGVLLLLTLIFTIISFLLQAVFRPSPKRERSQDL